MYRITVQNNQGASDTHNAETIAECEQWLIDTWRDVDNLKAVITEEGRVVATKPFDGDWSFGLEP